jgi:hypothetical protein
VGAGRNYRGFKSMKYSFILYVETDKDMGFYNEEIVKEHILEALRDAGDSGISYELYDYDPYEHAGEDL